MERSYKETVQENPELPKYDQVALAQMLIQSQDNNYTIAIWKDTLTQSAIPYRSHVLDSLVTKKPDAASWATAYTIVIFSYIYFLFIFNVLIILCLVD